MRTLTVDELMHIRISQENFLTRWSRKPTMPTLLAKPAIEAVAAPLPEPVQRKTLRLVHMGGGVVFQMPSRDYVDPSIARPRNPLNGQIMRNAAKKAMKSCRAIALKVEPKPLGEPATLMQRHPDGCCWPINDGSPYLYCNHLRHGELSYCQHHQAVAHGRARYREAAE